MNIVATTSETPSLQTPTAFPPEYFQNREMSLLAFNRRVLWQARNPRTPLLERLRFLCIVSSNLDEFFEIREAGIKEQLKLNSVAITTDGKTAREVYPPGQRRNACDRQGAVRPAQRRDPAAARS
jgi:polyphosphate kinase